MTSLSEQFYTLISTRQSDRGYTNEPIEKEKIEKIIEASRLAPSACNAQPWKFIVVDDEEIKNKLADTTSSKILGMNHFTKQAPVHIVIVMEGANLNSNFGSLVKRKHFPLIDIGIAAAHISLAATSLGLGSCIVGWFDEKAVKKLLNIPKSKRPMLIITLGYRAKLEIREKRRKEIDQVASYNKY
ncbi:MAG: nitroreductase family protein [Bacteroidales bacterium]|jgi:nitroreductase|nr:nitroreductase family protein [Bacteroidales bacterium]MDY0197929.1 nitroreductase family protein [Tenuifilaceae bacterium]